MILGIAWVLFLIFLLPHIGSIPYLDGNIDFVQAYDFYSGGFTKLAQNWGSLHPPLKVFIVSLFFRLFGIHPWVYTLVGIIIGLVGIGAMYGLARTLFGRKEAGIAALLLATSPLFLSVGIFSLTDYLLTVWVLLSLLMYAKKYYVWCGVFLTYSVLTKETALLLPISMLFFRPRLPAIFSLIVYAGWSWYLHSIGQRPWSDWIFTQTADKGAAFTIIHNLVTGRFLNPYAIQNWLHLFVLNYMWVVSALAVWGAFRWRRTLAVYLLFGAFYTISVLSFQTYTIPRYVLPIVPLILLLAAVSVRRIAMVVFLGAVTVLSLFTSTDPLSRAIWGETTWMGERLYNLRDNLSGNDGITYNLQYLAIVRERSRRMREAEKLGAPIMSRDCYFLFPDPNNEKKMIDILFLDRITCTTPR